MIRIFRRDRANVNPCGRSVAIAALMLVTSVDLQAQETEPPVVPPHVIKVNSKTSLLHLGSLDSFDRTEPGTVAARLMNDAVDKKDSALAQQALKIYAEIIPNENFGGEYTALQWICEYLSAHPKARERMVANKFTQGFINYWSANDYANLKTYLRFKYKFNGAEPKTAEEADLYRYQEDFILFANPRRPRWENTGAFIDSIGLKEGESVADIGCGPGYFSFQFAKIVGEKGTIYSVDTNERHINYVTKMKDELGFKNVVPRIPSQKENDVGIPKDVQVDCVFLCSLYHIVYVAFTAEERARFVGAIKKGLKPDGRLVILDNGLVEAVDGKRLPYHGPFIAKELIVAQLEHFGFKLVEVHPIIRQRYMLVFEHAKTTPKAKKEPKIDIPPGTIVVDSEASLVQHRRVGNPFEFSKEGRAAARIFYKALTENDKEAARAALKLYEDLSKTERIGNEYLAFAWFCQYLLADAAERKEMLKDPTVNGYFTTLGGDQFTTVKKFVNAYYVLETKDEDIDDPKKVKVPEESVDQIFAWMELIVFNSPRRNDWEKTDETMKLLDLKPGEAIADVGCGSGYYTYKFADKVGPNGKVWALETNQDALNDFKKAADRLGYKNIETKKSTYDNCHLPASSVDVVFLCSLYESAYVTSIDFVQERFIESIKTALKKNGRLVVIDNEINTGKAPPYFGPRIDRRLIVEQLRKFGFKLTRSEQFIPQRYILVFQAE
jgi:ubiquinone/menaquinone biosynthesis C-methylase UbiE